MSRLGPVTNGTGGFRWQNRHDHIRPGPGPALPSPGSTPKTPGSAASRYTPQILGDFVCEVSGKDATSFDAVALDKLTGKPAWRHAQRSPKSLKLTSDGSRLFLLQAEGVTALSGGPAG
ncbi:hypothetical protein [Streptomyces jumonjinensis]|uniref:Uncharacterized protein n=1 Tax=Streptomyces jumonjinensis TaxID=1945 RepID=A0A646KB24_STRJU|nr:hypothetical protein [Streptomyces jumonjinensis]MQS99412.1 hypothetical protein [Streptomyces jumonjinensis]